MSKFYLNMTGMGMETPNKQLEAYICQNCATRFVAPKHSGKPMILVLEDDQYYWICVEGKECGINEVETCCNLPYIEEF